MELKIEDTGFGWISPNGATIGCEMYDHVTSITNWHAIKSIPEVVDAMEDVRQASLTCESLANAGEHPEWHIYEMAEWDACTTITKTLYERGFVRIGVNTRAQKMGMEGTSSAIQSLLQKAKSILREYNAWNQTDFNLETHVRDNK